MTIILRMIILVNIEPNMLNDLSNRIYKFYNHNLSNRTYDLSNMIYKFYNHICRIYTKCIYRQSGSHEYKSVNKDKHEVGNHTCTLTLLLKTE